MNALLEHPEQNINLCDHNGIGPIAAATSKGHIHIVQRLLEFPSVDLNCQNVRGGTVLMSACSFQQIEIFKLFLQRSDVIDFNKTDIGNRNLLHRACESFDDPEVNPHLTLKKF